MNVKLYKVISVIVLIITVSVTIFLVYVKNSPDIIAESVKESDASFSDRDDKLLSFGRQYLWRIFHQWRRYGLRL